MENASMLRMEFRPPPTPPGLRAGGGHVLDAAHAERFVHHLPRRSPCQPEAWIPPAPTSLRSSRDLNSETQVSQKR